MSYDVFISHSSKDKSIADAVCAALETNGIRCWIAPRDIVASESWAASILRGISQSRLMVLVFSANANGSQHVHREVERAVAHAMPVLPVRVEDVLPAAELEYFLSSSHWLNAMNPPFEQHLRDLASTVRAVLQTRGGSPAAPPNLVAPPALPAQKAAPPPAIPSVIPAVSSIRKRRSRTPAVLAACAAAVVILAGLAVAAALAWNKFRPQPTIASGPAANPPAPTQPSQVAPATRPVSVAQLPAGQSSVLPAPRTQPIATPVAAVAASRQPVQNPAQWPVASGQWPVAAPARQPIQNPLEQGIATPVPATQASFPFSAPPPVVTPAVASTDSAAKALEAANRREAERRAAEQLAAERAAAEKRAIEKLAAEKVAAEKLAAEKLAAQRTNQIASLLADARSNDSLEKGQTALTALNQLLALDPNNGEAIALQQRIAAYYARELTNSLKMRFVRIEAGEFLIGTPSTEQGRSADELQHRVKISKPFMLGIYPVTQAQWMALMGDNPSNFKGDELPVEKVSWSDAVKFCEKLSAIEHRRYRLPTEAQWEYACRAGTTTPFYFGQTIFSDLANYDARTAYGNGVKGTSRAKTTQVGIFKPNPWGLFDMCGNVSQWCSDWYTAYPPGDITDPTGPAEPPANAWHVLRGGSYGSNPNVCRSGARYKSAPENRFSFNGFRVALDLSPGTAK